MGNDLISVVVPAYNNAPWLSRCLDSLLGQTYNNLEVIVVNDGSTDDTKAVLEAYLVGHDRVTVIHKENGGVTSARLRGVEEAKGSWIGFVDGDDVVEPQMYQRLMENAAANGADISHCGHQVCFDDGHTEYVHNSGVFRVQDPVAGLRDLLDGGLVEASLCTKLFRRELFRDLREQMDPTIKNNEDYLMNYFLFAAAKKSVFEDFCPYHYILRWGSASHRELNEHKLFDPIRVRETILARCPEELHGDAENALLRNILFAYSQLALRPDKKYDGYRRRVRQLLKEKKSSFGVLSARNRLLANMICTAPWTFDLAYGLFVKFFRRGERV